VSWGTNIKQSRNVHDFTGKAIENVMRMSLQKKSFDNVTVVLIAFAALEK
jgi:protein phosphatase 2C family protein 2/3